MPICALSTTAHEKMSKHHRTKKERGKQEKRTRTQAPPQVLVGGCITEICERSN